MCLGSLRHLRDRLLFSTKKYVISALLALAAVLVIICGARVNEAIRLASSSAVCSGKLLCCEEILPEGSAELMSFEAILAENNIQVASSGALGFNCSDLTVNSEQGSNLCSSLQTLACCDKGPLFPPFDVGEDCTTIDI